MAYAAVISLEHTIERLKINPTIDPQITKSLFEELGLLEDVLTRLDGSCINRSEINELDAQIRDALSKLEDVLEFYVISHSLPDFGCPKIPCVDENGVKQGIDAFLKTVKKSKEEYIRELKNPFPVEEEEEDDAVSSRSTVEVELSDQFGKIRDDLLDLHHSLKVVSLVGMAGIGKTFLARKIYERLIPLRHFNVTAWVEVGYTNQKENVLVDILSQIGAEPTYLLDQSLYQSLYNRRYFIVLDDVWNTGVWDYLKRLFPDNRNGSRVLLTTRLETVADSIHKMRFLSNEESWNQLWQNVFFDMSFPPRLEKAGRKIAELCEGLPLLILAVANILFKHDDKTEEYWNKVAERKTTTFPDAYDQISKVLSSSYNYLPQYLKPCFLYMGVFPQNCKIPLTKLINLWTVEDFLNSQKLEDFAMECLNKLVSHSLVIICKHSSNNNIKSSKLHSAYWHLCVKEARKTKFLLVLNKLTDGFEECIDRQRRLSVQNNILFGMKEMHDSMAAAKSTPRSLLFTGEYHQYPVQVYFDLVLLLRVLDALAIRFYEFPTEVLKLLQLRYLALTHNGNLPSFISQLQNLQCLIVRQHHNLKFVTDSSCYPKEIWDMQELRYLWIMSTNLPDPSNGAQLSNLSTLYVNAHSCTEDVFRSIPNLKKLGIKIELQPDGAETLSCFQHIGLLDKLESLKCVVVNPRLRSQVVAPPDHLSNLPMGLKKLSLNGLGYSWEYMSEIGLLPNLKVLKLRCSAFVGPEWETEVGVFQSLEFLLLEDIDMVDWRAYDDYCFPCLQHLIIRHCYKLREIPPQIGDIPPLKMIEIVDCSPSMVAYGEQIQERQRYYGNFYLQVPITSSWNLR